MLSVRCLINRSFATSKKIIFSGIQPSGVPHIGNYFGALKNWVDEQKKGDFKRSYFGIMSYHALTSSPDPESLRDNINNAFISLLACGLEPTDNTVIFVQSDNAYHCELSWILENNVNINRLLRMHQFKDKTAKAAQSGNKDDVFANPMGLLSYPVLMTADIMMYNATHVPVGEDQIQHVEIARDIIDHFNHKYNLGFNLPVPEVFEGKRIMSLSDGTKKMSKSSQSQYSNISIIDPPERIQECIKRAKTDSISGISLDKEKRPEVYNLVTLMAAVTNRSIEEVANEYKDTPMSVFKPKLADALIEGLAPIRQRFEEISEDAEIGTNIRRSSEPNETIKDRNWVVWFICF
ncbi:hypothetical protein WA171_000074 [Blastocystis sp. BT1]